MTNAEVLITILIVSCVTFLLRTLPFWVFSSEKKTPDFINWLGQRLPGAVMMMLVVYCLKDVNFGQVSGFVPELVGIGVTVALHVWKRKMILSISGGTAAYMVLIRLMR